MNAVVVVNLVEYSNINEDALFDGLTAGTDDVFGEAPKPNVDEWSPNIGSTTKATSAAQIIKDKNAEKTIISDDDLPF